MEKSKEIPRSRNLIMAISILIPFLMSMFCGFTSGALPLIMPILVDTEPSWQVDLVMVGIALGSYNIFLAVLGWVNYRLFMPINSSSV